MKKNIAFLAFIIIAVTTTAQSWISSNYLGGTADIFEISSTPTSDGGVISYGFFTETIEANSGLSVDAIGGRDYFLAKFDDTGKQVWLKSLGSNVNVNAMGGISEVSPGFIYVTGSFKDYIKYAPEDSIFSSGLYDVFIAKYDLSGNVLWCKNVGSGATNQRSTDLIIDNFGDVLISGFYSDSIVFNESFKLFSDNAKDDSFYGKFDALTGDPIWVKKISGINGTARIQSAISQSDYYVFTSFYTDSIQINNDTVVPVDNSFDALFFKTDLDGNILFYRSIGGSGNEYSYSIALDQDDNIYVGGYYNSANLGFQSSETGTTTIDQNNGDYDIFVAKYTSDGTLSWPKVTGGVDLDKIYDITFFDNEVHVSGLFTDQLPWGGISLNSNGVTDQDMFYGNLDTDGNYRSASSYAGRNNSVDEARALFQYGDDLITVMRSNSDLMVLGDSIYTNPAETFAMYIGLIGCLPLTVDASSTDVVSCKGDATGSINVSAADGFGGPFSYSIDNGVSYQEGAPSFADLAAGDYEVVVIDMENCSEAFGTVTITEPDTIGITVISSTDIVGTTSGEIVVEGTGGGSGSYFYTIDPVNEAFQTGAGTFSVPNEGTYTVIVNDANNCGPVSSPDIIIDLIEDIHSLSITDANIYPNPSNGMITVEFSSEKPEMAVEVYSMSGQRVMSKQVFSNGGEVSETFDMSDFAKGMYLIRVDGETLSSGVILK